MDSRCYIANVGDSRIIMSGNNGEKVYALSKDHRPDDEKEYARILDAGGNIYKTESIIIKDKFGGTTTITGPLRVAPGKLSVSRTIGDIEAKNQKFGGNSNVIISTPEIKYFDISSSNDFIVIGCDGVFEKMKNKEIIESLWKYIHSNISSIPDIHHFNGLLVEILINECLLKKSTDNLTAIVISFKSLTEFKEQYDYTNPSHTQKVIKNKINVKNEKTIISCIQDHKDIFNKIIKTSQNYKMTE